MRRGWRRTWDALIAVVTAAGSALAAPSPASADEGAAYFETVPAAGSAPYVAYVGDLYPVRVGTSDADGWATCRIRYGDGVTEEGSRRGPFCVQGKTWTAVGSRTVTATLTDDTGENSAVSVRVDVRERPLVDEVDGVEGAPVRLAAPASMAGSPVTWSMASGAESCVLDGPRTAEPTLTCGADGTHEARVTAADGESARVLVRLRNAAPTAGPVEVTAYRGPFKDGRAVERTVTGQALTILAEAGDPGSEDALTCRTDFGDGTVQADSGPGVTGPVRCGGPHSYSRPGRYDVVVSVTDEDGARTTATRTVRVAYRATSARTKGALGKARVRSTMRISRTSAPRGSFRLRLPGGGIVQGAHADRVETWTRTSGASRREVSWEGPATLRDKAVRYRVDLSLNRSGRVTRQRVSVFSSRRLVFHHVGTPARGTARASVG